MPSLSSSCNHHRLFDIFKMKWDMINDQTINALRSRNSGGHKRTREIDENDQNEDAVTLLGTYKTGQGVQCRIGGKIEIEPLSNKLTRLQEHDQDVTRNVLRWDGEWESHHSQSEKGLIKTTLARVHQHNPTVNRRYRDMNTAGEVEKQSRDRSKSHLRTRTCTCDPTAQNGIYIP